MSLHDLINEKKIIKLCILHGQWTLETTMFCMKSGELYGNGI